MQSPKTIIAICWDIAIKAIPIGTYLGLALLTIAVIPQQTKHSFANSYLRGHTTKTLAI